MPPSKVIRIDEQVWAELQVRARPLEDTPNSVLRRVFGLPEEGTESDVIDSRVTSLLELVGELAGHTPEVRPLKKGYTVLSANEGVVAYVRLQKHKLRIGASKELAEAAGIENWDNERRDSFFGGLSVRWYAPDGDEAGYRRVAGVLAQLWRADSLTSPAFELGATGR